MLSDLFTIYPVLAFVFRLIFYDSNNNFGYQKIVQDDVIETPAPALLHSFWNKKKKRHELSYRPNKKTKPKETKF